MKKLIYMGLCSILIIQVTTGAARREHEKYKVEFFDFEDFESEEDADASVQLTVLWGARQGTIQIEPGTNHSTIRGDIAAIFQQESGKNGSNVACIHPERHRGYGFLDKNCHISKQDFRLLRDLATANQTLSVLVLNPVHKLDFESILDSLK